MFYKWCLYGNCRSLCIVNRCFKEISNFYHQVELLELPVPLSISCGMGPVYTAYHRSNGSAVAIKHIDKSQLQNRSVRQSIRREIRRLKRFSHENILRYYDFYESPTEIQVVFELALGGTYCQRMVEAKHVRNEVGLCRIFRQILKAIVYIQEQCMLHGDVRPSHIVYAGQADTSKVVLVNFGRAMHITKHRNRLLYLKKTTGKMWKNRQELLFLPPGVAKNANALSYADVLQIDIWAWGILLYANVFGMYPFQGNSEDQLRQEILYKQVTFPPDTAPLVSRALKDLLTKIFVKYPKQPDVAHAISAHPWISGGAASIVPFHPTLVENMQVFARNQIDPNVQIDETIFLESTYIKDQPNSPDQLLHNADDQLYESNAHTIVPAKLPRDFTWQTIFGSYRSQSIKKLLQLGLSSSPNTIESSNIDRL